jgi:hypothetical protein
MPQPLLFYELDIYEVTEGQKRVLTQAVREASEAFGANTDEEVVRHFVERFDLTVPTLHDAEKTISRREIDFDVSRDPMRMFMSEGPFYIKGTEIVVHVPFEGDAAFFRMRPRTYTLSPPRGKAENGELLLEFSFPNDQPPPDLKSAIDRRIADIKQYLESLRESAAQLSAELAPLATQAWQQRKIDFANRSELISGLGIPIRSSPVPSTVHMREPSGSRNVANETRGRGGPVRGKKWDVFISHASEDKAGFASALASALRAKGLSVWYDDYALTVGDSLRQKIDEGLARSRFGIVILSPAFFSKHWPQQELNGLAAREVGGVKVILPVWHDLDHDQVADYSPMLADRMAVSSASGLDKVVSELMRAID